MTEPPLLAIDQGTTRTRAMVFDREGRIRGAAQRELAQGYPAPAWVEHDPEDIWRASASRFGVRTHGWPRIEKHSARH